MKPLHHFFIVLLFVSLFSENSAWAKEAIPKPSPRFIKEFECGYGEGNNVYQFKAPDIGINYNPWKITCKILVKSEIPESSNKEKIDYLRVELKIGQGRNLQNIATYYVNNMEPVNKNVWESKTFSVPGHLFGKALEKITNSPSLMSFVLSVTPIQVNGSTLDSKLEKQVINVKIDYRE